MMMAGDLRTTIDDPNNFGVMTKIGNKGQECTYKSAGADSV